MESAMGIEMASEMWVSNEDRHEYGNGYCDGDANGDGGGEWDADRGGYGYTNENRVSDATSVCDGDGNADGDEKRDRYSDYDVYSEIETAGDIDGDDDNVNVEGEAETESETDADNAVRAGEDGYGKDKSGGVCEN